MKRGDMPAQAVKWDVSFGAAGFNVVDCMGLTIRERMATKIAAGLCVNAGRNGLTFETVPAEAVKITDALLAELAKGGEDE